jgi:hypothetical protein
MSPRGGEEEGGLKADDAMHVHFSDGNLELSRSLMRALRHTGISLLYQDPSLRVVWAQNVPHSWSSHDVTGMTDFEFLPPSEAERVVVAKKTVLGAAEPQSLEIRAVVGIKDVDNLAKGEPGQGGVQSAGFACVTGRLKDMPARPAGCLLFHEQTGSIRRPIIDQDNL